MEAITADDELLRRIFGYHVKPDGTISSAAFMTQTKRPDPELSVHLRRLTTPEDALGLGLPGQGLVDLRAAVPLTMGLSVRHDPQPEDRSHCLVLGLTTKAECIELASSARLLIAPISRSR